MFNWLIVSSLMRYALEGSQDPLDIQELPAYGPTRPHTGSHRDQQVPHSGDEANEDNRDWSGITPKRQTKNNVRRPSIAMGLFFTCWLAIPSYMGAVTDF